MPRNTGPRSYVSEFQVRVGPINALGKLVKLTKSASTSNADVEKFVSVTPTDPPQPVKQRYVVDPDNPTELWTSGELHKARELEDGTLVRVSDDDVKEARKSKLPLNVFQATVHPIEDVEQGTYPGDNAYAFVPRQEDEYFAALVALVRDSGKAFIAQTNVRNFESLYRLVVWNDMIVLQKLLYPEDLNEFAPTTVEAPEAITQAAEGMLERIVQEFDPADYRSASRERLAALVEAIENGDAPPAADTDTSSTASADDLLAAIESFAS